MKKEDAGIKHKEGGMNWYLGVLKKYAIFNGRACRKEYWVFGLVNFIIILALNLLGRSLGIGDILENIYILSAFIPTLAVGARRLHDINRSGWWLLINLIPVIGTIIIIMFAVEDSRKGANKYGPNPKEKIA